MNKSLVKHGSVWSYPWAESSASFTPEILYPAPIPRTDHEFPPMEELGNGTPNLDHTKNWNCMKRGNAYFGSEFIYHDPSSKRGLELSEARVWQTISMRVRVAISGHGSSFVHRVAVATQYSLPMGIQDYGEVPAEIRPRRGAISGVALVTRGNLREWQLNELQLTKLLLSCKCRLQRRRAGLVLTKGFSWVRNSNVLGLPSKSYPHV